VDNDVNDDDDDDDDNNNKAFVLIKVRVGSQGHAYEKCGPNETRASTC
jgi:hypothetical protein